jgi:hypothetical protein
VVIIGSTSVVHALARQDRVDEYRIIVLPTILGSGTRFFETGLAPRNLRLVSIEKKGAAALLRFERAAATTSRCLSRGSSPTNASVATGQRQNDERTTRFAGTRGSHHCRFATTDDAIRNDLMFVLATPLKTGEAGDGPSGDVLNSGRDLLFRTACGALVLALDSEAPTGVRMRQRYVDEPVCSAGLATAPELLTWVPTLDLHPGARRAAQ